MPGVTVKDRAHVEVTTNVSAFRKISPGVVLERGMYQQSDHESCMLRMLRFSISCHAEEESPRYRRKEIDKA